MDEVEKNLNKSPRKRHKTKKHNKKNKLSRQLKKTGYFKQKFAHNNLISDRRLSTNS